MSKERELLKEVLEYFDPLGLNTEHCGDLPERIKELLAQPEQKPKFNFDLERMKAAIESPISDVTVDDLVKQVKQEPVAWKVIDVTNGEYMFSRVKPTERSYKYDVVIPLYTAPPKREPLGLEIMDVCGSEDYREGFKDGALYAEKCHGIGGGNE